MPYEEVTIIDQELEVKASEGDRKELVLLFMIPSGAEALKEIISRKRNGEIPKILRARLSYYVKYLGYQSSYVQWGYDVYMVDCSGGENHVRHHDAFADSPEDSGNIDITYLYSCNAPAMGIQGMKLVLYAPTDIFSDVPTPMDGRYRVTLKVFMSWGW